MEINDFIKSFADIYEDVNVDSLTPETRFKDVEGWDSITLVALVAKLGDEFGKEVTTTEVRNCNTIQDVFNLLNK